MYCNYCIVVAYSVVGGRRNCQRHRQTRVFDKIYNFAMAELHDVDVVHSDDVIPHT